MEKKVMKIYKVYIEDGENVYKAIVPAFSEDEAIAYCNGSEEIIAVKEDDSLEMLSIDYDDLFNVLNTNGVSRIDTDIILRALTQVGLLN